MEVNYPPYKITDKMLNYVSNIMEKIGKANYFESLNKYPELRRKTRIKSIHSSLAIGRTARLWQTAILAKWKSLFKYIPIESIIEKHQERYYIAIQNSNKNPSITQNEMAKILKLSRDGVAYNIKMLKNNGTLIREGSTKNGIWKIKI